MNKTHTVVRVACCDYDRIKRHVERLNAAHRYGRYAQPDVITMLLDSYENINKINDKSNESDEIADKSNGTNKNGLHLL